MLGFKMSKLKENKMDSRSLEKKLSAVRESSEEIQTLSRWCLQHKNHHHSIIQAWSRAVRKAKVPHRLTLFYVCNDIVQNARRKKIPDMVQHFATAIKEAAPLVRDEKLRPKIIRIFNIWEERGIYDAKLIAEFTEIVENVGTVNASENEIVLSSFQPVQLVEGIRTVVALEKSTESLRIDLRNQDFSLTDEEINQLRQTVKERGTSRERMEEFEEAMVALECYLASVQKEIEERTQVVTLLEQAEIFYETQRGEAKMVANAYKNFGNRVKTLKTKLTEKLKSLPDPPSPIPSPTPDAPSPENSDDEELSLPDSGQPGLDSFLNSSAFAEFAKDALNSSSGNLDSRLSALHKNEESPMKSFPEMSMSAVLEMEIRDSSREGSPSDDDVVEIPQREFPARDSMERQLAHKAKTELRESTERRKSTESRESFKAKDEESRDKTDSRDHGKSQSSRWDLKDSRSSKDMDGRRDNHDMSSSSSRRENQDHKDSRDEWDWDVDTRDYGSSRERRSSRSSRDSRDSHDNTEARDSYRSSSWDHIGSEREYKPRDSTEREYKPRDSNRDYNSHTHNSSYDSSLQIPKDLKPMSAAELLDTFGKVFSKSLSSGSSGTSPSTFEPVKAPSTPSVQPPIPDLSRPPPSLSIPLPPSNPPPIDSPYSAVPPSGQTPYTPTKPLYQPSYSVPPENSPKPSYCPPLPPPPPPPPPPTNTTPNEPHPFPPYDPGAAPTWIPPPPPPPPPPELMDNEISQPGAEYDSGGRNFGQSWSDYDEESDDRNWGEPPGNEELEALNSDTPSSPPPYEKGFMGSLAPPPLPPAFCTPRSNLRELVSEDRRTNLVSIQPNSVDSDYRCYNYSSLSEEPKPVPIPSIRSLFSSEMDQDLRVKKPGMRQFRTESGSDMDISNSESEDNMDISDDSLKEGVSNRNEGTREKNARVQRDKDVVHDDTQEEEEEEEKESNIERDVDVPGSSGNEVETIERAGSTPPGSDNEKDVNPITSIVGNSGNISPSDDANDVETVMSINAKEVESILSQMRKASSLNSANKNNIGSNSSVGVSGNVRVLTNVENESGHENEGRIESDENEDNDRSLKHVNRNSEESNNGLTKDANNDMSNQLNETSQSDISSKLEEYIPTVIAKPGERENMDKDFDCPRNVTEGNMIDVIDVMKNLDREFNQQKTTTRGGTRGGPSPRFMNRGRGLLPFGVMGRGERFSSPHNSPRGWSYGGPVFNSPRGRSRGHRGDFHRGTPPYSPGGRGFRGPNPNRGGRNWYGSDNW